MNYLAKYRPQYLNFPVLILSKQEKIRDKKRLHKWSLRPLTNLLGLEMVLLGCKNKQGKTIY